MKKTGKKVRVFNLIILDESGSMESIKESIISGFNELTQNIKSVKRKFLNQQHFVSFVTFNSNGIKKHLWNKDADELNQINGDSYQPDNMTPLYDTIGIILTKLSKELKGAEDFHVVATIMTDGLENHSTEYTGKQISDMITELTKTGKWTFAYIGTEHDIYSVAKGLSIKNVMYFDKSNAGVENFFNTDLIARTNLYNKIHQKKTKLDEDFYKDVDNGKAKENKK